MTTPITPHDLRETIEYSLFNSIGAKKAEVAIAAFDELVRERDEAHAEIERLTLKPADTMIDYSGAVAALDHAQSHLEAHADAQQANERSPREAVFEVEDGPRSYTVRGDRKSIQALILERKTSQKEIARLLGKVGECMRATPQSAPAPIEQHTDDIAVDGFAAALKEKLAQARTKGRGGWEQCDPTHLSIMLREHVEKGDPRDVANFCMFLWALGQPISDAALPMGKRATPAAPLTDERASFEAWALSECYFIKINKNGNHGRYGLYECEGTQTAWKAWQARAILGAQTASIGPMTQDEIDAQPDWIKNARPPEAS